MCSKSPSDASASLPALVQAGASYNLWPAHPTTSLNHSALGVRCWVSGPPYEEAMAPKRKAATKDAPESFHKGFRVGSKYRPKPRLTPKTVPKVSVRLIGGPFDGGCVWLSDCGDLSTLPFVVHGICGRYRIGKWEPA